MRIAHTGVTQFAPENTLEAFKKATELGFEGIELDIQLSGNGEWSLNISSVIVFGKIYPVEDFESAMEIYRCLSLKHTSDIEYIESEIRNFGNVTQCYELRPEHVTGKIVNEA